MKKAVILFNLGGPDSIDNVELFLFNLFNDKRIINLPQPIRFLLAWFIAKKRTPIAKQIYNHIGGKSPIVEQSIAQAVAVEKELKQHGNYKTFVAMRYWHPNVEDIIAALIEYGPDKIILLPLYPQFSTTTTLSFFELWATSIKKTSLSSVPTKEIISYPTEEFFIKAHIELIQKHFKKDHIILFSAHGIPQKLVDNGDVYANEVKQTVDAIINGLNNEDIKFDICYQSKVGRLKWLEPSTEDLIIKYGKEKKKVIIVPISFVSEHSETLVELDIEYKELAMESGIQGYIRVPALEAHPLFIKGLANLCQKEE